MQQPNFQTGGMVAAPYFKAGVAPISKRGEVAAPISRRGRQGYEYLARIACSADVNTGWPQFQNGGEMASTKSKPGGSLVEGNGIDRERQEQCKYQLGQRVWWGTPRGWLGPERKRGGSHAVRKSKRGSAFGVARHAVGMDQNGNGETHAVRK